LFGGISSLGFVAGVGAAVAMLLYFYFSVILMSLFKESLILMLSIAINVEKLAHKPASESELAETPSQAL
ncbi:MAG: hypothetical protein GX789_05215, partial [Pseudomonas formosensis]|nr:hypothetical protein [Halopseudomonas formosensis]